MQKEAIINWQVGSHSSDSCSEPSKEGNVSLTLFKKFSAIIDPVSLVFGSQVSRYQSEHTFEKPSDSTVL